LSGALGKAGLVERKAMIDRDHDLPVARQAKALGLGRSSVYYKPRSVSAEDLDVMRPIDELHLERPFAGARMLRDFLQRDGVSIGPAISRVDEAHGDRGDIPPAEDVQIRSGHKIYPYLLRCGTVERPN
jgi:putative transposase